MCTAHLDLDRVKDREMQRKKTGIVHNETLHSLQNYSNTLSPSDACTSNVDITV